jgi:hypothetical protein
VTSGCRGGPRGRFLGAPHPARALPRSLVRARLVEIATAPLASEPSITAATARAPTHLLCHPCRSRHREHLPALGTSTTHHPERPIPPAAVAPALVAAVAPGLAPLAPALVAAVAPALVAAVAPGLAPALDLATVGGSGSARRRVSRYATSWLTISPPSGSDLERR